MEKKPVRVWFDNEGDLLEVLAGKPVKGYFKDAGDDAFLRVDGEGNVIGFSILNVSKREMKEIELPVKARFSR